MKAGRILLWVSGVALVLLAFGLSLPTVQPFPSGGSTALAIHFLLELVSIVVSIMVVTVAWHKFAAAEAGMSPAALIFGLSVVAAADLLHTVTYPGMPAFFGESGYNKTIFFWLMARSFGLLTLFLIAFRFRLPFSRLSWQLMAAAAVVAIFVYGNGFLASFPVTHVRGVGVTPFKVGFEAVLLAGNLLVAARFLSLWRKDRSDEVSRYLAASCFIMALCGLAFMSYKEGADFINMIGHLCKVAAYSLLYRATFYHCVTRPYERLEASERAVRSKQAELDVVLSQVPAGVSRLDRQGRYVYVNEVQAKRFGKTPEEIIGRLFEEVVANSRAADMSYRWAQAMSGISSTYEGQAVGRDGSIQYSSVSTAPERGGDGSIVGTITVTVDVTDQVVMRKRLMESWREVHELRAALDTHTIVTVTDAKGVITRVNDKFCEISGYGRDELMGQTHRVVNSKTHPPSFFSNLWDTISSGKTWSGDICNRAKDGTLYWVYETILPFRNEAGRPVQYIAIAADISERKRTELQMEKSIWIDALTNLPNKRLLVDRLEQQLRLSERSGQLNALLLIDLDHFKEVNDTLGNHLGDRILKKFAEHLRRAVPASDTVARFAGDEFMIIMNDLGGDADEASEIAGRMAESLRVELGRPYELDGVPVGYTLSIGIVVFKADGVEAEALLKQADIAVYQAKGAGRNSASFFDPENQLALTRRLALETDLRAAFVNKELQLHYQPIVDGRRKVVAVEALLRWIHPVRGIVPPMEFIPLAEKNGLMIPIGSWVVEEACRRVRLWQDDPVRCDWTVSINVSPSQFRHPDFMSEMLDAIAENEIAPGRLKVEISEATLLTDINDSITKMETLGRHGVQLAIGNFGTGYSSLSYLRRLPIRVLKIDRSFVADIAGKGRDAQISAAIVQLARNLGIHVVAEGVETEAQFECLVEGGCDYFQGFLFGKPMASDRLQPGG